MVDFLKQPIKSRCRQFAGASQVYITDGMPIDILQFPQVTGVIDRLKEGGYRIEFAECFARYDSPSTGFFFVGEIVAVMGDGDLVYDFAPAYSIGREPLGLDQIIATLSVTQDKLIYNGRFLDMGRGQYRAARALAKELAGAHPMLEAGTPIHIPCKTRKGRGGWGQTLAARTFYKPDLLGGSAES